MAHLFGTIPSVSRPAVITSPSQQAVPATPAHLTTSPATRLYPGPVMHNTSAGEQSNRSALPG